MGKEVEEGAVVPKSDWGNSSKTVKLIASFGVYYCTFACGVSYTFLSPTIIDFSKKFDTDVSTVSIVFTILTASYLVGAFTCGVATRFLSRQIAIIIFVTCMTFPLFIVPYVNSIALFFVLAAVMGLGTGGYDPASISWIIEIWGGEGDPYILTQHFAYAVGAVIPPLILEPYLKGDDDNSTTTTMRPGDELMAYQDVDLPSSSTVEPLLNAELYVPFIVAGIICSVAIVIQIVIFFKLKPGKGLERRLSTKSGSFSGELATTSNPDQKIEQEGATWTRMKVLLLFLSCCTIGSYQGMELTTMQFLPTFSVFSKLELSEAAGARVLFGLTLAYLVGRGLGILVVLKVPSQYILAGNFVLIVGANIILLVVAQTNLTMLWVGSCMIGLGLSTVIPGFYAFIQRHLHVTDTIAAAITICGGGVSAIYPLIVGNSVEENPSVLIYVNLFSSTWLVVSFGVCYYVTMVRNRKSK